MAKKKAKAAANGNRAERRIPSLQSWGVKEGTITGTRARWLTPEVANAILDTAKQQNHVVMQFSPQDSLSSIRLTLGAFARRKGYKAHANAEGNTLRISLEKIEEE